MDRADPPADEPASPRESPWAAPREGEEPEPAWAAQIRAGRKARGERLKSVYARFVDEPTPLDDEEEDPA